MQALSKRNRIFLRSFSLTAFILACAVTAMLSMAYTVTVIEQNAYGRQIEIIAFDSESVTVLGSRFNIPLAEALQKVTAFIEKYSLGIIKLLGMAVATVEELILKLIKLV